MGEMGWQLGFKLRYRIARDNKEFKQAYVEVITPDAPHLPKVVYTWTSEDNRGWVRAHFHNGWDWFAIPHTELDRLVWGS